MKSQTKQFLQHLSHEIEDEEVGSAHIEDSLPLIGAVVMCFNIVEKNLDRFICEIISDRADSAGLIVLQKLMYNESPRVSRRPVDLSQTATAVA
ncbi:MAG: hypothetical protein EOP20_02830 [Hyphomicrobiales bacterium]|nr:MAG: hypothetical protein EOP20_02830 [Hyphomicrobiales bacterium]